MIEKNSNDAFLWNLTYAGKAFNLSRDTVRKRLQAAGVRPVGKRGGINVYSSASMALAVHDTSSTDKKTIIVVENLQPKDRKDWYISERDRLKFETEIGQLIPENCYREDLYETLSAVVSFFENLPDKMERTGFFDAQQLELLESSGDSFRQTLYLKLTESDEDGEN